VQDDVSTLRRRPVGSQAVAGSNDPDAAIGG